MMPIAFPMAIAFDISIPFVVGAVIGGGLFGDQCSPISDTTVLSSTGASCNHIVHVMTQLPYGITVGISAFVGFLFGGLTGQYVLSIAVTAAILTVSLITLTQLTNGVTLRRYTNCFAVGIGDIYEKIDTIVVAPHFYTMEGAAWAIIVMPLWL
mgnify:CR=1 FL=1